MLKLTRVIASSVLLVAPLAGADPILITGGDLIGDGRAEFIGDAFINGSLTGVSTGLIDGSLNVLGGSATFGTFGTDLEGSITVRDDLRIPFSLNDLNGDLTAGGDIVVDAPVNGSIRSFSSEPLPLLPPINSFVGRVGGGSDVFVERFDEVNLAPGQYGTLTLEGSGTVGLTAGTYTFDAIDSNFNLARFDFDTSEGAVRVVVADDLVFDAIQEVNGDAFFAGNVPLLEAAELVTLESLGNLTLGSDFTGRVIVGGDLQLDTFVDVLGSTQVQGDVLLGGSNTFRGVAIPEPASAALLLTAGATLLRRRKTTAT